MVVPFFPLVFFSSVQLTLPLFSLLFVFERRGRSIAHPGKFVAAERSGNHDRYAEQSVQLGRGVVFGQPAMCRIDPEEL